MFFNHRWIFFAVLYFFSLILYFFVNKQLMFTGVMSGPLLGSAAIFAVIVFVCFVIAFVISLLSKFCYLAICSICRYQSKAMLFKTFWTIFTVFCYATVFVIFLKMTEY